MYTLPLPADLAEPVYLSCIKGIRDEDLEDRLRQAAQSVAAADLCHLEAGADGGFARLRRADFELPDVTGKEMTWLYENKMVGRKAPGRRVYDAIKMAAPQGRCPL